MQSLDVISVNLWNIVVSLLNLVILFLLVKKFLFKPVNNMLSKRQAELEARYHDAEEAQRIADNNKITWENKIKSAKDEANQILSKATDNAQKRSDKIVSDAKDKADSMVRQAEEQIKLERKKAEEGVKHEIVEVSTTLANKMLEREINVSDHRELINSFIEKIGDSDDEDN